jgi:hypothetical protein
LGKNNEKTRREGEHLGIHKNEGGDHLRKSKTRSEKLGGEQDGEGPPLGKNKTN